MNKPFIAKIGTPDTLKQVDSDSDREILISNVRDVYSAHKTAMNSCRGIEEVLTITLNNKRVYDFNTGFITDEN